MTNVFAQAASELRTRGRCQAKLIDRQGRVCPPGAIGLALGLPIEDCWNRGIVHELSNQLYEVLAVAPSVLKLADTVGNWGDRSGYSAVYGWADSGASDSVILAVFDELAAEEVE